MVNKIEISKKEFADIVGKNPSAFSNLYKKYGSGTTFLNSCFKIKTKLEFSKNGNILISKKNLGTLRNKNKKMNILKLTEINVDAKMKETEKKLSEVIENLKSQIKDLKNYNSNYKIKLTTNTNEAIKQIENKIEEEIINLENKIVNDFKDVSTRIEEKYYNYYKEIEREKRQCFWKFNELQRTTQKLFAFKQHAIYIIIILLVIIISIIGSLTYIQILKNHL